MIKPGFEPIKSCFKIINHISVCVVYANECMCVEIDGKCLPQTFLPYLLG